VSPGAAIRALLGPHLSRVAGRWYRGVFVDLDVVAEVLAQAIPAGAHVLDIGGGDGEPLNPLLRMRPDVRVTSIEPGEGVGRWLDPSIANRVACMPNTDLATYLAIRALPPDVVMMADVVHHIAPTARPAFFDTLAALLARMAVARLIVKDVEPGHWRARLGYWSDRYVTGDRNVVPVSRTEVIRLVRDACGPLAVAETPLYSQDPPNFALVFAGSVAQAPQERDASP
jgi:hypothetical protein